MRHRRIRGLAEARKPFRIPRIEPVVDIMRSKKDVKVGVVGLQRQLHQEQRQMNRQRSHEGHGERDWPRQTFNRLRFLHSRLSKNVERKALIRSISRDAAFHGKPLSR